MFLTDKGAIFAIFTKERLKNAENFTAPGHECDRWKEAKLCSPPYFLVSTEHLLPQTPAGYLPLIYSHWLAVQDRQQPPVVVGPDGAACFQLRPPRHDGQQDRRTPSDRPSFCMETGQKTLASPTSP